MQLNFYIKKGSVLVIDKKSFDFKRGVATFERQDLTDDNSISGDLINEFKIPPIPLSVEGLAVALTFLPFNPPRPFVIYILTNETKLYNVTFEKREGTDKTSWGELYSYKISLAHLGLTVVFKDFFPDI